MKELDKIYKSSNFFKPSIHYAIPTETVDETREIKLAEVYNITKEQAASLQN